MSLQDEIRRHHVQEITLARLFKCIEDELSENGAAQGVVEPFDVLRALRDNGLTFTAGERGTLGADQAIRPGDISVALAKVEEAYRRDFENNLDGSGARAWVSVTVPTEGRLDGYALPIGGLWVSEENYRQARRKSGATRYRWPTTEMEFLDPRDTEWKNIGTEPIMETAQASPESAPAPTAEDNELGRVTRLRYADMGARRQAEAKDKLTRWKPFIAEAKELLESGGASSKSQAAKIVADRHPTEDIKPGTLRQKI